MQGKSAKSVCGLIGAATWPWACVEGRKRQCQNISSANGACVGTRYEQEVQDR